MELSKLGKSSDAGPGHPSELHLKATHAATACATCHVPHEWKAAKREECLGCHSDKTAHNAPGVCNDCHSFRQVAKAPAPSP